MQLKLVAALFAAVKAAPDLAHLTCLIDSNGNLGSRGWAQILPATDGVMLDVTAFEPARHRALTGQDNDRVLALARLLAQAGKLAEIRLLVISGWTEARRVGVETIAARLDAAGVGQVALPARWPG